MSEDPTRPIAEIENCTPQEVFEIMCDRFRHTPPDANADLVDFFVTTMGIDAAEQEYFTQSNDLHDRWETADREEFADLDRASKAIDEMRNHRINLRFVLAHHLVRK